MLRIILYSDCSSANSVLGRVSNVILIAEGYRVLGRVSNAVYNADHDIADDAVALS